MYQKINLVGELQITWLWFTGQCHINYSFAQISLQIPKLHRQLQRPIRPTDLECTGTLLAGINSRWYSYIRHKYYGTTAVKPTHANLKAELLQSDKNQITIPDETALVNVVTWSSIPEPSLPVSRATPTTSMDPLKPQLTLLQPLQFAECTWKVTIVVFYGFNNREPGPKYKLLRFQNRVTIQIYEIVRFAIFTLWQLQSILTLYYRPLFQF